jgi:hypothetical protein
MFQTAAADPFASTRKVALQDVPIAGALPKRKENKDTAKSCMTVRPSAEVPHEVEKYRRSGIAPGARVLHPGLVDDFRSGLASPSVMYGRSGVKEDSSWKDKRSTELQDEMVAAREQIYATVRREPLGKSYSRGFKLPETADPRGHMYGKPLRGAGESDGRAGFATKGALYPSVEASDEVYREQYIKSHHAYDVGQQKTRHYEWPSDIERDKKGHVFGVGVGSHKAMNNTSGSIAQQFQPPPSQLVVSERAEAVQGLKDQLGKARNLLQGRAADPTMVYGRSDRRPNDWDAKNCIEGDYSVAEQMPEPDLGSSVTPGFRKDASLLLGGKLATHAFGVPSIRSDLGVKAFKSVADSNNYGDDVTAAYLLYPPNSQALGVEADDFTAPRPKDELFAIFASVDGASPEVMDHAWAVAMRGASSSGGALSLLEFRAAFNRILEGQERAY